MIRHGYITENQNQGQQAAVRFLSATGETDLAVVARNALNADPNAKLAFAFNLNGPGETNASHDFRIVKPLTTPATKISDLVRDTMYTTLAAAYPPGYEGSNSTMADPDPNHPNEFVGHVGEKNDWIASQATLKRLLADYCNPPAATQNQQTRQPAPAPAPADQQGQQGQQPTIAITDQDWADFNRGVALYRAFQP